MCLRKSKIFEKNYSKPLVADKDIIVYKTLDHRNPFTGEKVLRTPYQFFPINFIDGKCVLDGNLECKPDEWVYVGFHSYVDEKQANMDCIEFPLTKMTKHWGIIPKGSKYFLGNDGDVVSNKLIIFETRKHFREYRRSKNKFV